MHSDCHEAANSLPSSSLGPVSSNERLAYLCSCKNKAVDDFYKNKTAILDYVCRYKNKIAILAATRDWRACLGFFLDVHSFLDSRSRALMSSAQATSALYHLRTMLCVLPASLAVVSEDTRLTPSYDMSVELLQRSQKLAAAAAAGSGAAARSLGEPVMKSVEVGRVCGT